MKCIAFSMTIIYVGLISFVIDTRTFFHVRTSVWQDDPIVMEDKQREKITVNMFLFQAINNLPLQT